MKPEGTRAGVANLVLCVAGDIAVYIEPKTKTGKQSKTQTAFE